LQDVYIVFGFMMITSTISVRNTVTSEQL